MVTKDNLTNSVFTIPSQFPSILYTCHSSNNFDASYPGLPLNQRPHFPESVDAKLVLLFQSAGLLLQPSGLSVSRCFCEDAPISRKKNFSSLAQLCEILDIFIMLYCQQTITVAF